jgi:hypothetical protein
LPVVLRRLFCSRVNVPKKHCAAGWAPLPGHGIVIPLVTVSRPRLRRTRRHDGAAALPQGFTRKINPHYDTASQ